ncbi:MAG: DoxX family membrane protein [Planctomycetota bacterium]
MARSRRDGRRRGAGGGGEAAAFPPRAVGFALLLLRLYAGAFFLATAHWKLVQEGWSIGEKIEAFRVDGYVPTIERAIAHPPEVFGQRLDFFAAFLRDVMLPAASWMAPAILFFEVVLGLGLVLGLGTRLLGALGFLMMLAFSLAKGGPGAAAGDPVGVCFLTVRSANWPMTLILLALALGAAGRFVGLDRRLRRRMPPWLGWIG